MRFGDGARVKAGAPEQGLRQIDDLLGVLQRAGGVIGDDERPRRREIEIEPADDLADVSRERRDAPAFSA